MKRLQSFLALLTLFVALGLVFSCGQNGGLSQKRYFLPVTTVQWAQTAAKAPEKRPLGTTPPTQAGFAPPTSITAESFYFMRNYTSEDGLALDSVRSSLIGRHGNLWFGTYGGGVSKYDGLSFTNFSEASGLVNDAVQAIFQDKAGNIWFGTIGGVSKFDGTSFTNYTKADGLASDEVSSISEDSSGRIWFGTGQGLSVFNGKSFSSYSEKEGLIGGSINKLLFDKSGNLWLATTKGISKFDGNTFTNYSKKDGLVDDSVNDLILDSNNVFWFATFGGISSFDGKQFTNYSTRDGLIHNSVITIHLDKSGTLWFGTLGGVSSFDKKAFQNLSTRNGLANDAVATILEDNSGNLWFGTKGGGISKFQGNAFTNFTSKQGLPNSTFYNILEDRNGNLWFGTDGGGLVKYDGKSFSTFKEEHGLPSNSIHPLFDDGDGNIWLGSVDNGLVKFGKNTVTVFTDKTGLVDNYVQTGLKSDNGTMWIGTNGGLSQFDGDTFTNYTKENGLANNIVFSIIEDKNNHLWFATNGGVSRFDGTSFYNLTKSQGLPSDQINGLLEDTGGNIWISTASGLSRYDGKSLLTLSVSDGLPDSTIWWTTALKDGQLLIGTNKGLAVLAGFSERATKIRSPISSQNSLNNDSLKGLFPVFEIYNLNTGYPVKDANQGSFFLDKAGALWFGTGSDKTGLVRFDYASLNRMPTTPIVHIRNIKINNDNIFWNNFLNTPNPIEEISTFSRILSSSERERIREKYEDIRFDQISTNYFIPTGLKLPYEYNTVSVDFFAIEPDKPQNILYQYKFNQFASTWSQPKNQTSAVFGNLNEGTYKLSVRAKSPFSDWSSPTTFDFTVLPPWYRTWWAYALYILTISLLLFALYRWRTASLRKRQRELELLQESTERFLPRDFLELINKHRVQDVALGDSAEVDLSIMFSDIRAFTTLAEKLGHHTTSRVINEYMSYMAPIVRKYNGVVGQFLGDGIMAFFKVDAKSAVDASLEMRDTLPKFNAYLSTLDIEPVEIGIGINEGPTIFSITGEEQRLQATIISDDVNLAARVEGLNKLYSTNILITGAVFDRLDDPESYLTLLVDRVVVVGKSVPIRVYAIWKKSSETNLKAASQFIEIFSHARALYEKGDFKKAEQAFLSSISSWPDSKIARLFVDRCIEFQQTGTPIDWDGTIEIKEK